MLASLDSLDQVTLGKHPAVPLSSRLPVIAFGTLEPPSGLAGSGQVCWHVCLLYSAEWCRAWYWAFLSSCYMQILVVFAHPGFFSHPSSSLSFISVLILCFFPNLVPAQPSCPCSCCLLTQSQAPAPLPSMHGWASTLSSFLVGHMALGGSFHQRLELWWGLCCWEICSIYNTCVHSWKCVDKSCFSYLP